MTRDRWIVTVAAVVWIAGMLFGTGLIGGGVSAQGGGLFSDEATLIAPDGPAFSIWSVIYVGLAAYVIWQWLPASEGSRWTESSRIPAAVSIALNGVWLFVVQADLVLVSVIVILGIALSLGWLVHNVSEHPRESLTTDIVIGLTFGFYLGWVSVATCANVASYLVGIGVPADTATAEWITVGVLVMIVALVAVLLYRAVHRSLRFGIAASAVWGASWIAVGRFTGDTRSDIVAYAAVATALLIALLAIMMFLRREGRPTGTEAF
ncbi:TspO/MBR family protein [Blastococcus sp. Marseille-P5729]|uniref:TspO/MBR family protein n=1 Tax=Blastococcus sp. Marseille-P5729 TaxID=2086582 RepID=UPI000D0FAF2C|nr:TspO/MBR family protein [Blastococcus sp. Marseille-P5729]